MNSTSKQNRYWSLDGLRAYSAIGILLMHVLTNGDYALHGFLFENLIPAFTNLVFLFMMISSFSMCCGYFDRVSSGAITPADFYDRRFSKIWPFFAMLVCFELLASPSVESIYEAFANLTLCFALLPNAKIEVIGVGWTLGVIFVFYLLFPFLCFLLSDKRKAWITFVVALIFHYVCVGYFFDEAHVTANFSARSNILYCAVYFVAGGMIYLYRDVINRSSFCVQKTKKHNFLLLILILILAILYFQIGSRLEIMIFLFASIIIYAIQRGDAFGLLNNRVVHFLSGISMEIYLSHMVIYRVVEKLGMNRICGSALVSYLFAAILTACGTILLAVCFRKMCAIVTKLYKNRFKQGDIKWLKN